MSYSSTGTSSSDNNGIEGEVVASKIHWVRVLLTNKKNHLYFLGMTCEFCF
jgi:hypothetical protein